MNMDKSPGYDGINIKTIMSCTKEISKPLAHIYNLSFSSGLIPEKLKIAVVQRRFYTVADAGPAPSRAPRFRLKVYDAILLIIIYIFSLAGPLTPRWRGAL
jgi:hypothetical protein